ncbi:CopG family transcriptional regulator [Microbacterium rhizophilus]|uniref:CopG family transcriptional regulator n=1 Tax=Microbacterium rhizophilus TaxID=3138934 RepID=UPI0031EE466C
MRTTLNFPDALARAAKERAAQEGLTFTSFLEQAVRERLARTTVPAEIPPPPTFRPNIAGALIDIDDKDALWDVLDERA